MNNDLLRIAVVKNSAECSVIVEKRSWLAWFLADYWYRQKKYCESCIEKVV